MIAKQDILDRAIEWQLRPDVVEKDYVLGWLLAGLASTSLAGLWIFKGGTCIKKCYFETYRFSEDLDFSLLPEAPYTADALTEGLRELAAAVAGLSGLAFPEDFVEVRERRNKQGQQTFEGKLGYRGPLVFPGSPKIRFDFTQHEPIVDTPASRPVFHPYDDGLPEGVVVQAYSFPELLAEKTRALVERSRPRDLYDVVHLIENAHAGFDLDVVRRLFEKKCQSKGLAVPTSGLVVVNVRADAELRSEWGSMLGHQLPVLPDLDALLERLPAILSWLEVGAPEPSFRHLPRVPSAEAVHATGPGIRYWGQNRPIEAIRFAGTNRLMISFMYHGSHRVVEPYSIRQAKTGNVLLYGWEVASNHIKAFKLEEMQNVSTTDQTFAPRYRVDLSPGSGAH